ncbi:MAG TPA: hypothetical protein VGS41_09165 [Chthonomonadales bacterium]|nr:hypothetical protein [Chthonomonadales bacterium]
METAFPRNAHSRTEIVAESCPQCGYHRSIRESRTELRFVRKCSACPRCGYAEEQRNGRIRKWKGYGVYVLRLNGHVSRAGSFARPVPNQLTTALVAHFLQYGEKVCLLTRWNEEEGVLETLIDAGEE